LGTGAAWKWYSGSCGGTSVGTGSTITISPGSTTTYYVRAEGTCNTTGCLSTTVSVKNLSTSPTGISGTTSINAGASTTLSVTGGSSLGTGGSWKWYAGGCGGTSLGSGSSITVTPGSTTTYYVRAEGDCNTTLCASTTVTVCTFSSGSIQALPGTYVKIGTSTSLTVYNGVLATGAHWSWYVTGGSTVLGTGVTYNFSAPYPNKAYYYTLRAIGGCVGDHNVANITITTHY